MKGLRAFRWLMRLLPSEMREAHGRDMEQVFRAEYAASSGSGWRFWWRTVVDILRIAPRQHAEALVHDVRYALRTFARAPMFTTSALLTIALGVGATTAVFAVVDAVLIRPLPFPAPHRIAIVWAVQPEGTRTWLSLPEVNDVRERVAAFESVAGLADMTLVLTGAGEPAELSVVAASESLPRVFGVAPQLGAWFTELDDRRNANGVVVLSDALWRNRFGASPGIVGAVIQVNGRPHTVAGVMPRGFEIPPPSSVFPSRVDAWVPLHSHVALTGRDVRMLHVFGRLAPGATIADARQQAIAAGRIVSLNHAEYRGRQWAFDAADLTSDVTRTVRPALLVLFATAALVLFIAAANIAALLLSRGAARQHEMAVRIALGASSTRLARQLVTEALTLGAAGGVAGVALARSLTLFTRTPPLDSIPRFAEVVVDWRVTGFAMAVSMMTMVAAAVVPLVASRRGDVTRDTLRARDRSRMAIRAGNVLATGEVALGCTVLIVALLLARSFGALMTTDPGFSTESLLTFRLSLTPKYANAARISAFFDSSVERVGRVPGVNSAAAVTQLPMSGASLASTFLLGSGDARRVDADLRGITPGYFDTMQMRVLGGRAFSARDTATTPGVAVVDEAFARKAWPGESAVGKRIRWFRSPQGELEVVGVVTSVRHRGFDAPPRETVYRPHTQYARPTMYLAVRTSRSPDAQASAAVAAIRAVDSDQPVAEITTMSALAARSLAQPGIGATLSALFALIALALTAVGVYGVVAYAVSQRTREFGVRLALGASPGAIRTLILAAGVRTGLVGLLVGVPSGWVACRFVERTMALPVSLDVATLAAGMAVTIVCAVGACWVPSLRASRVSPSEPLRAG